MAQVFKKVSGTTSPEWIIGPGDIDTPSDEAVGVRTSATGELEVKESGGTWLPIAGGGSIIETKGLLTTEGGIIYDNNVNLVIHD